MRAGLSLAALALPGALLAAEPAPPPPATALEEAAAVQWLKASGHVFDPSAYGEADLAPLVEKLGGARIIGIGEATHGGHQDQAFKAELIKALVRAGKTDVLMLEANRAGASGFDRYIRFGEGDLGELIHSKSFFATWKDDEFAGLVLWLRAWNMTASHPVRVVGIDCQDSQRDAVFALAFVTANDPKAARRLQGELGPLLPERGREPGRFLDWFKAQQVPVLDRTGAGARALERWFAEAPAAQQAKPGFAEARMAARTAVQGFDIFRVFRPDFDESKATEAEFSLRDSYMAGNAAAVLAPQERATFWAHDLHVADDVPAEWKQGGYLAVGMLLEQRLGADYRSVGFTWSDGAFWASTMTAASLAEMTARQKPEVQRLPNNRPGELGHVFDQTGAQAMWVDFTARPHDAVLDSWARRPYWRGWAGWGTMPGTWQKADAAQGYLPSDAALGFDVVVWFRTLSPARRWPSLPAKK